jgi:di/tricarboxylate transporter
MSIDALIVIIVLIIVLISLYFELAGTSFTFLIAVAILGIFGILTPREIISGFSNEQIAVIVMLLILGDVIRRSSVVEYFFNKFFKGANTYNSYMRRMMVVVGFFSAFVNKTCIHKTILLIRNKKYFINILVANKFFLNYLWQGIYKHYGLQNY